jgi:dihydroxyacid dehydratase/phosphogluconate dehydratase
MNPGHYHLKELAGAVKRGGLLAIVKDGDLIK